MSGGPEDLGILGAEVEIWFPVLPLTLNHCEICPRVVGAACSEPSGTHGTQEHHGKGEKAELEQI